ncbi:hypothetical protein LCGC14_2540820 [marine sediment metagenome]|uniref:Uncharacterized protein n=1 Tax=marine sediment metagenome TaxID=412755 RepID=A0A0F9AR73_9ZZZZ
MKEVFTFVAIVLAVLCFVLGTAALGSKVSCKAKTAEIRYQSDWGFFSGCRIKVEDGKWIPLERYYYRELGEGDR